MVEKKEEEQSDFGEWCQMTGWHGILDFYNAKHLSWKIIWVLVVLVGCFFAIVQGANMIIDFTSDDEWVTTISYEAPKKGSLEWPNITICGLSTPPIGEENRTIDSNDHEPVLGTNYTSAAEPEPTTEDTDTAAEAENDTTVATVYDTSVEITADSEALEPSEICPRIMVSCGTIDGRGYGNGQHYKKCCNGSQENPKTDLRRRCFTLKPDAVVKSQKESSVSRIYYLFLPTFPAKKDSLYPFADAGFEIRLYLGYSDTVDDFSSTFYVLPGTRNVISMISEVYRTKQRKRLVSFSKVDVPPCSQRGSYSYLTETTYTKDLCATDCRIEWQMHYCGCYTDDYSMVGVKRGLKKCNETAATEDEFSADVCTTLYSLGSLMAQSSSDEAEQRRDYMLNFVNESFLDEVTDAAKCLDKCPEPCEYGRTEAKISSSLFVGQYWAADLLNKYSFFTIPYQYSLEEVRKVTMLEMYYEIKQQRVIEKKPRISLDEFISNLGGCLGVWSGISFLSVVQIFFYLVRALVHCLKRQMAKNARLVKPTSPQVSVKTADPSDCVSK